MNGGLTVKKCSKCNKKLGIESFHRDNSSKDGLWGYCIICEKERQRVRYKSNRLKIIFNLHNRRIENIKKFSEYEVEYRKNNWERIKSYQKAYRERKKIERIKLNMEAN